MQNNNPKVSNILTLACKVTGKRITLPEKDFMQAGTILIVDDNKSVLTSLELLLEDEFEAGGDCLEPEQYPFGPGQSAG